MRKKIPLALALPLFLLAACGPNPNAQKKEQPNTQPDMNPEVFRKKCVESGGRLYADDRKCQTRQLKALPPFESLRDPNLEIVPHFYAGEFVVAVGSAPQGRVDILLGGNYVLSVPGRWMGQTGTGQKLNFFVNGGGYKDVSVTVWTCKDHNMNRIHCEDGDIPPSN